MSIWSVINTRVVAHFGHAHFPEWPGVHCTLATKFLAQMNQRFSMPCPLAVIKGKPTILAKKKSKESPASARSRGDPPLDKLSVQTT